jgi:hypothetical protein
MQMRCDGAGRNPIATRNDHAAAASRQAASVRPLSSITSTARLAQRRGDVRRYAVNVPVSTPRPIVRGRGVGVPGGLNQIPQKSCGRHLAMCHENPDCRSARVI